MGIWSGEGTTLQLSLKGNGVITLALTRPINRLTRKIESQVTDAIAVCVYPPPSQPAEQPLHGLPSQIKTSVNGSPEGYGASCTSRPDLPMVRFDMYWKSAQRGRDAKC